MQRLKNRGTQPFRAQPVFNNWDVVAKAWYIAFPSHELGKRGVSSRDICGQRVVFWRGEDGKVRATDAFCPHMGTDLGIGRVDGTGIRCFFHHWKFEGDGRCADIPCLNDEEDSAIPGGAKLASYAVEEKYGFVWIWPEAEAPATVVEHEELKGREVLWLHGEPFTRRCHHHVNMINGIDAQHLRTVHKIHIDMEVEIREGSGGRVMDFLLRGEIPTVTARERFARKLLGARYEYAMRYADASIGCLTLMKNVTLFGGKRKLPELTMIFAYRPLEPGRTLVQPIYLAPKGSGLFGGLKARFKCHATRRAFFALRDEDGQIYENIRFHPGTLLPIDAPVARFISRVNQLEPSKWSRTTPAVESAPCELTARAGETGVSGEAHATPDCVRGY